MNIMKKGSLFVTIFVPIRYFCGFHLRPDVWQRSPWDGDGVDLELGPEHTRWHEDADSRDDDSAQPAKDDGVFRGFEVAETDEADTLANPSE